MRKIIHVDMDAFYASVEQRDNPALRGQAVIVGGRPDSRGVVAACSYEARAFGIHSAMPSAEAARRCPQAIFVKPRFEVYKRVSAHVHEVFREFTEIIEPLSLDEAYLDVSNSDLFEGSAVRMAREIRAEIRTRTALVASAGVSYNKFLAKLASDHDKPDGLYCVLPEQGEAYVASLPVGRFHGVGRVTEARMHALGIDTGADLRALSLAELESEFGKSALWYFNIARGIDERPVRVSRTRKSMGGERTFSRDLTDPARMMDVLGELASDVFQDLGQRELLARTVTVKVRFSDFETLTRAHSERSQPVNAAIIRRALPVLLERALAQRPGPRVRLLGISFSGLAHRGDDRPRQLELDDL